MDQKLLCFLPKKQFLLEKAKKMIIIIIRLEYDLNSLEDTLCL